MCTHATQAGGASGPAAGRGFGSVRLAVAGAAMDYLNAAVAGLDGAACRDLLVTLGKKNGPGDDRTDGQRFHDALQMACVLLPRVCCSWTGRYRPVARAFVCHMDLYGMVRIPWRYKDGV